MFNLSRTTTLCGLILVGSGCANRAWDGQVHRWGTLREALHQGQTEGRVRLAGVAAKPHAYGVGAIEGLAGEVLILDSKVWVARSQGANDLTTFCASDTDDTATILAVAYVPGWTDVPVTNDVAAADFDSFIGAAGARAGFNAKGGFPFLVEGSFADINLHVINGSCPIAASNANDPAARQPYRAVMDTARGTLIGFYAEGMAGILMHHDSNTHVHALIWGSQPIVGHVDTVVLKAGAVLHLPVTQ